VFATLVTAATNTILGNQENAARRFMIELKYEGADISADVAPFVTSFNFVDSTDKIDEISLSMQDVQGLWRTGWWPKRGAKFAAKFRVENWFNPGDSFERNCGQFEIDDFSSSGPPSIATIKAVAVGISSSIRRQQNTKAWENVEIKLIAQDIADKHKFELKWYSNYNPILERWQQDNQSDLACLKAICEYAGMAIKITDKAIVIFRLEEFDNKNPEITIRSVGDGVKGYSINANSADIYSACLVNYYDPTERKFIEYLFNPEGESGIINGGAAQKKERAMLSMGSKGNEVSEVQTILTNKGFNPGPIDGIFGVLTNGGVTTFQSANRLSPDGIVGPLTWKALLGDDAKQKKITMPEVGQVLKINQRFRTLAEAIEIAKSALRRKNMQQIKGNMSLMGRPDLYSGLNFIVKGYGQWDDSVYNIEEVRHDYNKGSGYNGSIQFRGILGY